ncbi:hypothetical protein ILUMI_13385 [Ignelater luminosus]|uniref:Zinc carboxypeptidase A 1 n=1 Tax=Ignelater luminosus TaxID=2038154 RepID=A0A8K0CWU4_IGNLU|nr:hypothetical protein ILUMI_13385 [Ignelater luminosus]
MHIESGSLCTKWSKFIQKLKYLGKTEQYRLLIYTLDINHTCTSNLDHPVHYKHNHFNLLQVSFSKMSSFLFFVFITTVFPANTASNRFDNFTVYRVVPRTSKQLEILRRLQENTIDNYNFWTDVGAVGHPVDIMVPPNLKSKFLNFLSTQRFEYKLWINNVQRLLDAEKPQADNRARAVDWSDYYNLETIYHWMDKLNEEYPATVTPIVIGYSYEKREIRGIKVSFGATKKTVFIEGGMHAREWISPAVVTYILNEILSSNDGEVREMAESRDWYFFPVCNPDGYVYTHSKNRFWRKTRKPYGRCYGADPNRNWNFLWMQGGASNDSCTETFAGSSPFSEIEVKNLAEFIGTIANTLETYLSFHSYSQLILTLYGRKGLALPKKLDQQLRIARAAADGISFRYGTIFRVGSIVGLMGVISGTSVDYVKGTYKKVPYVYAIELRDQGRCGFVLPKQQIIPSGREMLDGLVRMFREIGK